MSDLKPLYDKLDDATRCEVIASVVVTVEPKKTEPSAEPLCTITQEAFDLQQAIAEVTNHAYLLLDTVLGNVNLVLRNLKLAEPKLRLYLFHCVQIYNGGVAILRIINKSSEARQFLTVDMADLRQRLEDTPLPSFYRSYIRPHLPLIGGAAVTLVALAVLQWRGEDAQK